MADKHTSADSDTMIAPNNTVVPFGRVSLNALTPHIYLHMSWRGLKPSRMKYRLTANQCILLSGLYVYSLIGRGEFTINSAMRFIGYWNDFRTKGLIKGLMERDFIIVHSTSGNRVYYRLSPLALDIAKDIMTEFNSICQRWYKRHNLSI